MKKLILIIAAFSSFSVFADTVTTRVGSFKGTLAIASGLDIKKVEVIVSNQFCNFWGTTCAGGPRDSQVLPAIIKESADGKTITVSNEGNEENSSLKVGLRFSSCNIGIAVEGINSNGQILSGSKSLLFTNKKEICSSREKVTELVRKELLKTIEVSEGFNYLKMN